MWDGGGWEGFCGALMWVDSRGVEAGGGDVDTLCSCLHAYMDTGSRRDLARMCWIRPTYLPFCQPCFIARYNLSARLIQHRSVLEPVSRIAIDV